MKSTSRQPSLATLILFAAIPSIASAQAPEPAGGGALSYVGPTTRIGIGMDSDLKGRGEISQVLTASDTSALIGELWAARHGAGGLQLQYNWLAGSLTDASNARVHKLFAAIDQNADRARKVTFGYGQEREAYHWSAYLSKGIDKDIYTGANMVTTTNTRTGVDAALGPYTEVVSTVLTTQFFSKPYEWGVGIRAGKWVNAENVRVTLGVDHEWAEDSNRQTSVSVQAEKYFANTPLSISLIGGIGKRSGPFVTDSQVHFGQIMLRYDLSGHGRMGTWNPGPGWRAPQAVKRTETVTEMRTETRTEMRSETKTVEVPVQTQVPGSSTPTSQRTEQRTVARAETVAQETYFDLGRYTLTPKSRSELDAFAANLRARGQSCRVNVAVIGNTCPTGPDRDNLVLSQRRANVVRDYLAKAAGINATAIPTEGRAGRSPKYPEVRGQTFRNRRADSEATITCDVTENVTVDVPGTSTAARTETRMEKRTETVQVPVQVQVQVPVQVQKERTEYVPVSWIPRALMSSTPHLQTVSMYTKSTSTTTTNTAPRVYSNQCPAPVGDALTVAANSTANMIDVLANDKDPDGNTLSIASVTQPAHGTATITGGKVAYTPAAGYSGADTFTYTVSDGYCGTKTATVNVTVTQPVNLTCSARHMIVGCNSASDVDLSGAVTGGSNVTITVPNGQFGTVQALGGNRFRYTANASACFSRETITYSATDVSGATCTGTLEVIDPKAGGNGAQ